ncbi:MAG: hypothetical protein R3A48_02100 [Polyangiales bacterium]
MRPSNHPALACALSLSLAPVLASAQCVLEGVTRVDSLRVEGSPMPLEQRMRVTLAGAVARVEGLAPLVFRAALPLSSVRLYLGPEGLANRVMAASPGLRVEAREAHGAEVTATLVQDDALSVRGLRLPCAALSTTQSRLQRVSAPSQPARARWASRSVVRREMHCTPRGGGRDCAERVSPTSRCRPLGDASWCGYHPPRGSLRVFSEPNARSESVEVEVTRDVAFIDEDQRGPWLRVTSQGLGIGTFALRGWVRAREVRWSQEVPPGRVATGGGRVSRGRAVRRGARDGFVALRPGTPLLDDRGEVIARTGEVAFCTRGELREGDSQARVALPGADDVHEGAQVAVESVQWVPVCP